MKYRIIDACFACTTPYQVLGAISIVLNHKIDADLYIFGVFPNYEMLADRISETSIFNSVNAVDCSEIGAPGRIKGVKQMLFSKKTVSFYLPTNVAYNFYYSTSRALPKEILHHVLLTRNPKMAKVIYEDGMGTYASNSHPLNVTKLLGGMERVLRWNLDVPSNTRMMAYIPQLVELPDYLRCLYVEQMPRLSFNSNTSDLLNRIFNSTKNQVILEKFIIFDTLRRVSVFKNPEQFDFLDKCYEVIHKYAKDDIICKPHPKSLYNTKAMIKIYNNTEVPMEVLYAQMNDLNERTLISYTSSAVFTPKIMFGIEPRVISLHRLLPDTKGSMVFEGIYCKFRGIYENQDRVVAPSTLKELEECMTHLT